MRKIVRKYISPFFGTDTGKLNVPYFWSTLFLTLTAMCIVSVLAFDRTDLNGLIAIMFAASLGMIANYNIGKTKTTQYRIDAETAKKYDAEQEGPK